MEIGEQIAVGRMGRQPYRITDPTVDPQHATLKRTADDTYVLADNASQRGTYVFGLRIVRKTVKADTPVVLGAFKTSVRQLLTDADSVDLTAVWTAFEQQRRRWDRYSMLVNSIRMFTPVLTMLVAQMVGQNWLVSGVVLLAVTAVSLLAGEKVLARKTMAMAALNARMQADYACPHCHRFLGFVPYAVLRTRKYCPHCGVPLK